MKVQSPRYRLSSFYISRIVLLAALTSSLVAAATIPVDAATSVAEVTFYEDRTELIRNGTITVRLNYSFIYNQHDDIEPSSTDLKSAINELGIPMNNNKKIIISLLPALLLATILTTAALPLIVYGQDEEEEEEDNGGDGGDGVTATVNGESFNKGDAVTISGSVGEEGSGSNSLYARVYDPDSIELDIERVHINADGTFRYGIATDAGPFEGGLSNPMTKSGTYTVTFEYFGDSGIETGEVTFEYNAESASTTAAPTTGAALPSTIFQSNVDGIRVGVPDGWIAHDIDNEDPTQRQIEETLGYNFLITLCPQEQALPQIGGEPACPGPETGIDSVSIARYADLKSRPEFAGVVGQNENITISDLLAYYLQFAEEDFGFTNLRLIENVDREVKVVDPQTNESATGLTAPAKYIEMSFENEFGTPSGDIIMLVLSHDGNTGYALYPAGLLSRSGDLPPQHQQIFDSFELLASNNSTSLQPSLDARTLPPQLVEEQQQSSSPSPFTQQLQSVPQQQQPEVGQQENQGEGTAVSIVPGSSSLTTDAFSPNPIQVNVGDTVTWTNDDAQPHTTTSGENLNPDGRFDSGIMAPGATFQHTFTEAGEFPYFCLLHPNQVGTVIVR